MTDATRLMERLGLDDDELMRVLDADPLAVITDELDHRPEIGILLTLTEEAEEQVGGGGAAPLAAPGPAPPVDLLLARDFAAFEDALADLADRGFVMRGGGSGSPATRPRARLSPGQTPVRCAKPFAPARWIAARVIVEREALHGGGEEHLRVGRLLDVGLRRLAIVDQAPDLLEDLLGDLARRRGRAGC